MTAHPIKVYVIRNGPAQANTANDIRLSYYKFYKQATEGAFHSNRGC